MDDKNAGQLDRIDRNILAALSRNARLSMADLAAAVGLSPRRLETLFRAAAGMTPGAWALHQRLQAARRLTAETPLPLAEIALRTGFSSAATLGRAFRKAFGASPGRLRRR